MSEQPAELNYESSRTFWRGRAASFEAGQHATALTDYVPAYATEWGNARLFERRMKILRQLGPYRRALDIGCGDGRWTTALSEISSDVVATDFCEEFVEATRAMARSAGRRNVTASVQDVRSLDVPGPSDLVVLGAVTMYVDDGDMAKLTARLAKELVVPGGLVYIRASTHRGTTFINNTGTYQAVYRPPAFYRELFERHGFTTLEQRNVPEYNYADILETYYKLAKLVTFGASAKSPALQRMVFQTARLTRPISLFSVLRFLDLIRAKRPRLRSYEYLFRNGS
ncbi:MAG: class I SAM-dependent methyltransferase [Kofleriaceae bacterium]